MFAVAVSTQAQVSFSQTASNPTGAISNSSVDTMNFSFSNPVYYGVVGIQPVVTKSAGTMAGKAYLFGSVDGVNHVLIYSLALTNNTINTTVWKQTAPVYKAYRITVGGATTVTATATAKILALQPK